MRLHFFHARTKKQNAARSRALRTYRACVLQLEERAMLAAFNPNSIVALRVGDGTSPLSADAAPVFLDEFATTGSLRQSIAMPTGTSGSNHALTLSGSVAAEGALNLSTNGRLLTLGGYDAAIGTASVATTNSSTNNRTIGVVDVNGIVDTTTRMNDAYTGGTTSGIRSAVTVDGTQFWTGGQGGSGLGGVRYVTYGNTGGSSGIGTVPNNGPNNARVVNIFGGQLYLSLKTGMVTLTGIATIGTGLPTTNGQSTILLPNLSGVDDAFGYVLLDRDSGVAGYDTLYVADQSAGLRKWSFDGAAWNARGVAAGSLTGLAAMVNGAAVDIYATSGTGAGNSIVKFTDTASFSANLAGAFTTLATAGANTAFRGLAFAPRSSLPTPSISINDIAVSEGDSGPTDFVFTVTQSGVASSSTVVTYTTVAGTATAGSDFTSTSGTLTLAAGLITQTFTVSVNGDTQAEPNETFSVTLSNPVNANISGGSGTATITNDDYPWYNGPVPSDVDGDTFTSAIDLVHMVDALNSYGGVYLPQLSSPPTKMVDVNRDNNLSGIDLVLVVEALNSGATFRALAIQNDRQSSMTPVDQSLLIGLQMDGLAARTESQVSNAAHRIVPLQVASADWAGPPSIALNEAIDVAYADFGTLLPDRVNYPEEHVDAEDDTGIAVGVLDVHLPITPGMSGGLEFKNTTRG